MCVRTFVCVVCRGVGALLCVCVERRCSCVRVRTFVCVVCRGLGALLCVWRGCYEETQPPLKETGVLSAALAL